MSNNLLKAIGMPAAIAATISMFSSACHAFDAVPSIQKNYQVAGENFPNPERGFYIPSFPNYLNKMTPLNLAEMQNVRANKMSLVRRYYNLQEFRNAPISQTYLDMLKNDFKVARQAGIKLIIRFSYNWIGGGPDAPRDRILAHLEQLRPILAENYDVIAYLQAGFIGFWGEWNRSSNNLLNPEDTRAIVFKILSVLPTQRMVAIRYPKRKFAIFNSSQPVNQGEAFTSTYRARSGNHNQCFLASSDDWGTYSEADPNVIEAEKSYLSADNLYVVQGGETCNSDSEAQPFIGCRNAIRDAARLRFSDLNYTYEAEVIDKWRRDGCLPIFQRSLGYRFVLKDSTLPTAIAPGGNFKMKFNIFNRGWASPYNPRLVEIVLRNRENGTQYYLPVNSDPRKWLPGTNIEINIDAGLPANMQAGSYDIFLNLPDPAPKLYGRPEYSIRLANKNTWEAKTGYNSFLHAVSVAPNGESGSYSGNSFFQRK